MICPNVGPVFLHPGMKHPFDVAGGHSHIVDYMGSVVSYSPSGYNTAVAATIDVEALRQFRVRNLNSNWIKDLRTEIFRTMYDQSIHPKNLWMKKDPEKHEKVDQYYRDNIRRLIERGTFTAPAHDFPGCSYKSASTDPEQDKWENIKQLWNDPQKR
jgi:hypothetical protein